MSNLTKYADQVKGELLAAQEEADLLDHLSEAAQKDVGDGPGFDYLDFSGKKGEYNRGRERSDMDPDDLFVLCGAQAFLKGWIAWKEGSVLDRVEWPLVLDHEKAVPEEDLAPLSGITRSQDGWKEWLGFMALPLAEDDRPVRFGTNSTSGKLSVGDLSKEMSARRRKGEPFFPVFSFDKTTFTAQGDTNWKPIFPIETWVSKEATHAWLTGELSVDELLDGVEPEAQEAEPEVVEEEEAPKSKRKATRRRAKAA